MLVTPFGSCRVEDVAHSTHLNKLTSYTHCTKETIQLIKFIKGELKFDAPHDMYCLRKSIKNGKPWTVEPAVSPTIMKSTLQLLIILDVG